MKLEINQHACCAECRWPLEIIESNLLGSQISLTIKPCSHCQQPKRFDETEPAPPTLGGADVTDAMASPGPIHRSSCSGCVDAPGTSAECLDCIASGGRINWREPNTTETRSEAMNRIWSKENVNASLAAAEEQLDVASKHWTSHEG